MAKRKKGSKVQSRAKLRRPKPAKRGKARKAAQAKRVAKPKRPTAKKAARQMKQPVVETVAVEVVERPIAITEVEEIEVREVGPGRDEPEPC